MQILHEWCQQQLDEKHVEPNSVFGQCVNYILRRQEQLTVFLREPGVPLDNKVCEQALQHRKNVMCFKTQNITRVGDA